VICGELGVAGACLVVALYIGLMVAGLAIVRECRHAFGRLLGLGVLLTIGMQALINLAVVTGMIPTKGIALPLLSNGGTGWVMTSAAVGLLVAIDRINRVESGVDRPEADDLPICDAVQPA
jgi:cell division protein FtsW